MSDFTSVGLQNFSEGNSRRPIDEEKFCKDACEIAYIQDLKPKTQVPMNYQELAQIFPLFYAVRKQTELPAFAATEQDIIPHILHYIWLGENKLPQSFKKNMFFLAAEMKKRGGTTLLWADHPQEDYPGITVLDAPSYFGTPQNMTTFYQIRAALAKIPANYGEASDLLRYEILERLGGYYLDFDIDPEQFSFTEMLAKGAKAPHGFIAAVLHGSPQNNAFGAAPGSSFLKILKERIALNYETDQWKEQLFYQRPYLIDTTTFRSGPEAFGRAIDAFFETSTTHTPTSLEATFIPYASRASAESWVFHRLHQENTTYSVEAISHDLILNLLLEKNILDLAKYAHPDILSLFQDILTKYPLLFSHVDRLFTRDKRSYMAVQNLLEKQLGKTIIWNELATLKFACLFSYECLIDHLIHEKQICPFDSWQTHVGEYDCTAASPFAIALERGFKKLVTKFIHHNKHAAFQSLSQPSSGLIYAGAALENLTKDKPLKELIPLKIELLQRQAVDEKIISHFREIQSLLSSL